MSDAEIADVTRRTRLAAERTWLAWWRTGIAATTASIAVGGLVLQLVEGTGWPSSSSDGYALLAVSMFAGELRKRAVDQALDEAATRRCRRRGGRLLLRRRRPRRGDPARGHLRLVSRG